MVKKFIIILIITIIFTSCVGSTINNNNKIGNRQENNNNQNEEIKGKKPSGGELNIPQVEVGEVYSSGNFIVKSSEVSQGGILPITYTCDGSSSMLPISWNNAPENTTCYVAIMSHFSPDLDTHSYMVRYDIPGNTDGLLSDSADIGSWGINTVNRKAEYAPPCSKGPGDKKYTYTVYALSTCDNINGENLTREQVINSMSGDILDSATLDVVYSR
ncbi:MAG: hypothetical protein PHV23_02845 [Candidatus Gracilibacteria bacterium]|nr:hypothetical protein [Candidatus Gracilibacteria bacterium]